MKKIDSIDALRGVAVLLVILVHAGQALPTDLGFTYASSFGQYGVQLFFVMSSFTLCHSFKKHEEVTFDIYKAFFLRRFFRIAPLYYFSLPLYFCVSLGLLKLAGSTPFTEPDSYSIVTVGSNVLFLHGLYPPGNNNMVPGGWSIGCEFLFYAIFPFLFVWTRRNPNRLIMGMCVCFFLMASIAWLRFYVKGIGGVGNNSFLYFFIVNQFSCFALGMLYYHFGSLAFFRSLVSILALVSVACLIVLHEYPWGYLLTPLLAAMISVGLAMVMEKLTIPRFLKRLGELSFSMYVWHFIPVWVLGILSKNLVSQRWQGIVFYLVVVALTYVLSVLSHRFLEVPGIELGHKLSQRLLNQKKV